MKIKAGQIWVDKKHPNNQLKIVKRHHDIYWNCILTESTKSHKMSEFAIRRYFYLKDG